MPLRYIRYGAHCRPSQYLEMLPQRPLSPGRHPGEDRDFDGFPPTILVSGTREMFLSDTVRAHRKLRDAGVTADLHVFEGLSHAGYLVVAGSPESISTFQEVGVFFKTHLK